MKCQNTKSMWPIRRYKAVNNKLNVNILGIFETRWANIGSYIQAEGTMKAGYTYILN